jgi:hypothetical protein
MVPSVPLPTMPPAVVAAPSAPTTVDVFYVSHVKNREEDRRIDIGKFFSQADAEAFVGEIGYRKDVRIDMKTEPVSAQHSSHRSP